MNSVFAKKIYTGTSLVENAYLVFNKNTIIGISKEKKGVVPGSGNIISGHSAVIRNYAADSSSALVARAGIKAAFGYNPMSASSWKGTRPTTRMGAMHEFSA